MNVSASSEQGMTLQRIVFKKAEMRGLQLFDSTIASCSHYGEEN